MDEYTKFLIDQFRANQANQQNRMANAPDSLLDTLASYGLLDDQQALQLLDYKRGHEGANTPMPGMHRYGDNHVVAANPMEIAAAAIKQYRGNEQQNAAMAQMQANLLRKRDYNRQMGEQERNFYRQQAAQPPQPVQEQFPQSVLGADPIGGGRGFVIPPTVKPRPQRRAGFDENGDPQSGPWHDLSTGGGV